MVVRYSIRDFMMALNASSAFLVAFLTRPIISFIDFFSKPLPFNRVASFEYFWSNSSLPIMRTLTFFKFGRRRTSFSFVSQRHSLYGLSRKAVFFSFIPRNLMFKMFRITRLLTKEFFSYMAFLDMKFLFTSSTYLRIISLIGRNFSFVGKAQLLAVH